MGDATPTHWPVCPHHICNRCDRPHAGEQSLPRSPPAWGAPRGGQAMGCCQLARQGARGTAAGDPPRGGRPGGRAAASTSGWLSRGVRGVCPRRLAVGGWGSRWRVRLAAGKGGSPGGGAGSGWPGRLAESGGRLAVTGESLALGRAAGQGGPGSGWRGWLADEGGRLAAGGGRLAVGGAPGRGGADGGWWVVMARQGGRGGGW